MPARTLRIASDARPASPPRRTQLPITLLSTCQSWCPEWLQRDVTAVRHAKLAAQSQLGISIQPAQPGKPTDKPTCERFFKTLREGLIQHLPAYKGPDIYSRGEHVEDTAFLFTCELEDIIAEWVAHQFTDRSARISSLTC